MGQLVLGLAGAFIGNMIAPGIGASVGFALGSFAYTLIDPQKIVGPRLQDSKVRGANYGTMRPIVYGTMRVGGLGMGQGSTSAGPNQFTEHEEKSSGKGGPEVTEFRYTLSFFDEICEGPIAGVRKRWANARLITGEGETESSTIWPFTLYLGDTTQMPDPTMETVYGVGEISPMRGVAYEAHEELDVTDYGNARPNVEYEVFTAEGTVPRRVASFRPWSDISGAFYFSIVNDGGTLTATSLNDGSTTFYRQQWATDGTPIGSLTATDYGAGMVLPFQVANLTAINAAGAKWYVPDASDPTTLTSYSYIGGAVAGQVAGGNGNVFMEPWLYGVSRIPGDLSYITRYDAPGGVPGDYDRHAALDALYADSDVHLGSSDDGSVYALVTDPVTKLWKFDADLNLLHFWNNAALAGTMLQANGGTGNFFVHDNLMAFKGAITGESLVMCVRIDPDTFAITDVGTMPSHNTIGYNSVISIGGCLGVDEDGVFSVCGGPGSVMLGDIVYDLCVRAGLTDARIDTSDLTQDVRGFVIASQMTIHNAIQVLRQGFFFDAAEYDGKIVFVNRGHDAIATIPDGDLAAHEPGSEPPEPLEYVRTPEAELPMRVNVTYYDLDTDYQPGSQHWSRMVTRSEAKVTLDLPIVFTASEAMQRAQWHMHFAWLERDKFTWFTTRAWSRLTPTDVVIVRGVNIRIISKAESPNGLIKFEGVRAFAGAFTGASTGGSITDPIAGTTPGAPGSGQPGQEVPQGKADTAMILLDLPWLTEAESANSFRVALYKDGSGSWPGAALYKSVDSGTTYSAVAETSTQAIVGTCPNVLATFTGGNTVDESNVVRVNLVNVAATLSSTTDEGLLNGLNLVAIGTTSGWEILQYRTASLVSAGVYDLTGLMRGRFGTEWMMGAHAAQDVFVLLSTTVLVPIAQAHLGLTLKYKAVTYGTAVADADVAEFICQGVALKPFAPVLLGGGRNASGDLLIHWTPRRRGSGGWPNGVDLPPTESPEAYWLHFATDSTFATIVFEPGTATATYTYTAARQTTDFGSPQSAINVRVQQAGAAAYGYYATGTL